MDIFAIGIDIGGTKTNFAAMEREGRVVFQHKYPSRELFQSAASPAASLEGALRDFCQAQDIDLDAVGGIVIGVPGKIDPQTCQVSSCPNLKLLEGHDLGGQLRDSIRPPVLVENDVNLIAIGEQHRGAGQGIENFACVYVGTGIGGGLILNGRLHAGADGAAGELGHMPIVPGGRLCTCGARGCLEMYCSGKALATQAATILGLGAARPESTSDDEDWNLAAEVVWAAQAGNARALEAIETAFTYLGLGITQLATIINPRLVILGGGIFNAWPQGVRIVEQTFRESASVPFKDTTQIVLSTLKDDASFAGAHALVSNLL